MSVRILIGDVRDQLRTLADDSIDCVVTSPPYWGLRDYGVDGQIGMEPTLGEHLAVMVDVFREVRRVAKPEAAVWINYGDCYATSPNGRSAADTKAAGTDDRTFRDKPFSTVGPIYDPKHRDRNGGGANLKGHDQTPAPTGRVVAGGTLKPKDLCLIPFRLAIALQEDGWWIRSRCMWGKPNAMPDSSGRYRPAVAHEELFLLSKSGDLYYDYQALKKPCAESSIKRYAQNIDAQEGSDRANAGRKTNGTLKAVGGPRTKPTKERGHVRAHTGFNDRWDGMTKQEQQANGRLLRTYEPEVWEIPTVGFTEQHFATFPPALVQRMLTGCLAPGGVVLDPFGGAGTTGLVAESMGFDSILIELNPESAAIADNRIRAALGRVEGKPLARTDLPEMLRLMEAAE